MCNNECKDKYAAAVLMGGISGKSIKYILDYLCMGRHEYIVVVLIIELIITCHI